MIIMGMSQVCCESQCLDRLALLIDCFVAQVAYSETSDRWIFPNLYHSHSFAAADGSFTVDLIMIDTVELAGL